MATNAKARVEVTFIDGSEAVYHVSADKGIASKLPSMIQETGALSLWNDEESFIVIQAQIRSISISDLSEAERAANVGPVPVRHPREVAA